MGVWTSRKKICRRCIFLNTLDIVVDQLGSSKGIYLHSVYDILQEEVLKRIEKYGVV